MDTTATTPTSETVLGFYGLLAEGKVDDALSLLDDDALVHEPAALPYGGEYRGKPGFGRLLAAMGAAVQAENVGEIRRLEAGETVVLRMRARFTGRASGQVAETDVAEVVTVRDGKILEIDVYYRDPGAVAAVASATS
jgi:hypothetical protein